jgi:rare lipoprotein A
MDTRESVDAKTCHWVMLECLCRLNRLALLLVVCNFVYEPVYAAVPVPSRQPATTTQQKPDLSGHPRVGKASFYAKKLSGKKMADGEKMNPHRNNAASKTLPLGTTAKVTNLETGQSANVTIQDRGPYVHGRIVDLSPSTAQKIGITPDNGVSKVKVEPIAVPQPDGSVKAGSAASGTITEK